MTATPPTDDYEEPVNPDVLLDDAYWEDRIDEWKDEGRPAAEGGPQKEASMIWSKDSGASSFKHVDPGTYVARCCGLIDLGTQEDTFDGKKTSKRKVMITFELPTELMDEGDHAGTPYTVSKFYAQSLHEKAALRADLVSWRGRDFTFDEEAAFDPRNLLGKACMVSIVHNAEKKARIQSISKPVKGMPIPEQFHPSLFFSLSEFDRKVFESLSEGIRKMIERSPEYQALATARPKTVAMPAPGDRPADGGNHR